MSTNATAPTGRYIVTNHTLPLNGGKPGDLVGVSALKPQFQAWYLEDAPEVADIATEATPADAADKFRGMKRYILRTEEGSYFLEESQIFFASELATTKKPPQGPGIALPSYNATTTAEKPNAWVFVLDGEYSNGTFEGRLVSPHGRYALGLRGDGSVASPIGTAYMSPTIEVNCGTWKLQLSLLGEDCEDKQE